MNLRHSLICLVLIPYLLSGCAIYNSVVQKPMYVPEINVSSINNNISINKIKELIIKSCAQRGWNINSDTNNVIQATLIHHGKEKTVIEILYSKEKITINYKESSGMRYKKNQTGERIHRSYNRWVKNIEMDIRAELMATK